MYRCAVLAATAAAVSVFALPLAAQAQQQLRRAFPENAYRGVIVFGAPPAVRLDGQDTQLAPGSRVRNPDNMLVLSGELVGNKFIVNYTVDPSGIVKDVWILRDEEVANKPWPRNPAEASQWVFDPVAQTWTKP